MGALAGYSTMVGSDLVGGQGIWREKGTRVGFLTRIVVSKEWTLVLNKELKMGG